MYEESAEARCDRALRKELLQEEKTSKELREQLAAVQLSCKDTQVEVEAKRKFVAKQTKEAKETGYVTLRNCGEIRTGTIPAWLAFRCLYCGEYFNQTMAEEHFGMTREAFFKQQAQKGGGKDD